MRADPTLPTEEHEQIDFVQRLELEGLRFTAIPNSTYTTSGSQKNHRTGLRAGFPDLVVLVPADRSHDGQGHLLAIEMKRLRGSTARPEQREWIDAINGLETPHVAAYVARA